jgi:2-amino-4-hydroxy-6-hydroxymethyldihydropteridine diphosphokinase
MVVQVGIALGSNLGDREAELDAGLEFLKSISLASRLRVSPRMRTAPVGCPPGSEPFLNAVAEIEADPERLPPRELLRRLQKFEGERGRPAGRETNAPRPLDLDIIYYGALELDEPGLVIPHPRAAQRRFVLEPLSHLRPDLVLPGQMKTVAELAEDTDINRKT